MSIIQVIRMPACPILKFDSSFPRTVLFQTSIIFIALSSIHNAHSFQKKLENSALSGKNIMIIPVSNCDFRLA